jgi:hypothetical protein
MDEETVVYIGAVPFDSSSNISEELWIKRERERLLSYLVSYKAALIRVTTGSELLNEG